MNDHFLCLGKRICTASLLFLALTASSRAATNTWSGTGNWTSATNWSQGYVPLANEDVVINGIVTLTNSPALLGSFTVNAGRTNTFSGWDTVLTATVVTVNGTITHSANTDTNGLDGWQPDARVYIQCTSMFIATNGSINASAKGYAGATINTNGCGPGGGMMAQPTGSGGYGGAGGMVSGTYGQTYGSYTTPEDPGSGGGYYGSSAGGNGGGAIRVTATGQVIVNGNITANGGSGVNNNGNGGSGGSIFITCATFGGTNGAVSAMGGNSATYAGASGGGGRIAIIYTNAAVQATTPTPGMVFSTGPGTFGNKGYGDIGTLYFPDNLLLTELVPHSGQWMVNNFTNWSPSSLTISNAWFRFPATNFSLTVSNSLTVIGGASPQNQLELTPWRLECGGDLILTNRAGATNGAVLKLLPPEATPDADGCGPRVKIGGTLEIGPVSKLHPYANPTNGCGIGFEMQNLTIATNGTINADGLGFRGGTSTNDHGKGTGGTLSTKTGSSGGGGYGGAGGYGATSGGVSYGESYSNAPIHAGSGSGYSGGTPSIGLAGGGLIRLSVTNRVLLNGSITANGISAPAINYCGGGSGGGIFILCRQFDGYGALNASGGRGGNFSSGGGGGGRIAVWSAMQGFSGTIAVTGGVGTAADRYGQTGTVVRITTSASITNLYATNLTASTASLVGNLSSTGMAPTTVFCYWGTNDGGTVKGNWTTNAVLPGVQSIGQITNNVSNLTPGTLYHFRFVASNSYYETWSEPFGLFSTTGGGITLDNDGGATDITRTSATLRGYVSVGSPVPDAYACWGTEDPQTDNTNDWEWVTGAGPRLGAFSVSVTGLVANQTYYYRCYASNGEGDGWAPIATNFTMDPPLASIADAPVTEGGPGDKPEAQFTVTLSEPSAVPVTIAFETAAGTATSDTDYVATNGTLVIDAGESSGVIRVTVNGDEDDEFPGESFSVVLTGSPNADFTRDTATGWITDDDDVPESRTWTGTGSWNSVTNWLPLSQGRPSPSDSVTIPGATSCTLTNSAQVSSLTVNSGGTLTFGGWDTLLTADTTLVSGTITHSANTDTNGLDGWQPDARVHIQCTSLFVATNGSINVDSKGYSGGVSGLTDGRGPGGGRGPGTGGGGGYGGTGGSSATSFGTAYGSTTGPADPGSGGGMQVNPGGWGGGAIRIAASGPVVVSGTVSANGGAAGSNNNGGGSGGSVYITCSTFTGTNGILSATGGPASSAIGGGGGGRIAVVYTDTVTQNAMPVPSVRFTVAPGSGSSGSGDIGTLYFPDNRLLTELIPHSGQWMVSNFTNWAPASLTISNAWFRFAATNFNLNVGGSLTVLAGPRPLNQLELTPWRLDCGGDLMLTNLPGATNGAVLRLLVPEATPEADGCGPRVTIGGTLVIAPVSRLFPYANPTNGCGIGFRVQELHIATNGAISADGLGFRGGLSGTDHGQGPGGTRSVNAAAGSGGAGYGGMGGDGYTPSPHLSFGGAIYGESYSNAPIHPGSGSGASSSGTIPGLAGGGLIRIEATRNINVDGAVTANGISGSGTFGGGGSGGGIYLSCLRLEGGGLIQANGGSSASSGASSGGGGGGGRIALRRSMDLFSGAVTANAGAVGGSGLGQNGTVVRVHYSSGSVFLIR